MKQKHLLSLLQSGYTTIQVVFDNPPTDIPVAPVAPSPRRQPAPSWNPEYNEFRAPVGAATAPGSLRVYTYKARQQDDVKQGDAVVVETPRSGMCIARVVGVDPVPRIDLDAEFDYKWIVQKVDRTEYDKQNQAEEQFNDTLQEVERVKQREKLLNTMQENLPQGTLARQMFDNAVAAISAPVAPQVPQVPQSPAAMPAQASEDGMACK